MNCLAKRKDESEKLVQDSLLDEWVMQWYVASKGYNWADGDSQRYLTHNFLRTLSAGNHTPYNPLEYHHGLLREFARTEPTEEGFKAFADRFGLLLTIRGESLGAKGRIGYAGEPWSLWLEHGRKPEMLLSYGKVSSSPMYQAASIPQLRTTGKGCGFNIAPAIRATSSNARSTKKTNRWLLQNAFSKS
jgi:hypothetical protein